MRACLDAPTTQTTCNLSGVLLEGWAVGPESPTQLSSVEAWIDGRCAARTLHWFPREDVTAALSLPGTIRPGFALGLFPPAIPARPQVAVELRFFLGEKLVGTLDRSIAFAASAEPPHPPSPGHQRHPAYPALARLIKRSLHSPADRIVELNCGRGDVGRSLCLSGIHWHGIEGRPEACEFLAAMGLPHARPRNFSTPYRSGGFKFALALDTTPAELEPWMPELKRLATEGLMLSGKNSGTSARIELERLLSGHFPRFETLPFQSAETGSSIAAAHDRWFLFASGWS
ncbi:MAG: hypothetical protein HS122_08640 [Opitutaceae bacterium]|nr:hypothetical protein [Opitutaceae bacterium]